MITILDCIELSDLTEEEIDAIAEHEHLPFITALEKGTAFLHEPWGSPALRQMVGDDLRRAEAAGRFRHADELRHLYVDVCGRHPGGTDRRHASYALGHRE